MGFGTGESVLFIYKGVRLYMLFTAGIPSTRCSLGLDCMYPYYVAIDEIGELLPIHVGYPPGQYLYDIVHVWRVLATLSSS